MEYDKKFADGLRERAEDVLNIVTEAVKEGGIDQALVFASRISHLSHFPNEVRTISDNELRSLVLLAMAGSVEVVTRCCEEIAEAETEE